MNKRKIIEKVREQMNLSLDELKNQRLMQTVIVNRRKNDDTRLGRIEYDAASTAIMFLDLGIIEIEKIKSIIENEKT